MWVGGCVFDPYQQKGQRWFAWSQMGTVPVHWSPPRLTLGYPAEGNTTITHTLEVCQGTQLKTKNLTAKQQHVESVELNL